LQTVGDRPILGASLWVIMTLLLMIVMVVTALRPTLITISDLWGQIGQRKETIKKLDSKIANMQIVSGILAKNRDDFELLNEALPENPAWEIFSGNLNDAASESGVKVVRISWEAIPVSGEIPAKKEGLNKKATSTMIPEEAQTISYKIVVGGEYPQIIEMVRRVENMRRLSVITGFSIGKTKEGLLTATIDGVAIYMKGAVL
jgi:Tfp pilus assembly protein PilO